MSHFRIRYTERGGHTHMAVFAGRHSLVTHGKCGDLCMTNEEFAEFKAKTKQDGIEFIDEGQS